MSVTRDEEQLYVSTDGTAGPYIIVPVSLLDSVRHALSEARISFTIDEDAVSLAGQPALSVVDLGDGADIVRVREVLEGLPGRSRRPRRADRSRTAAFPEELILRAQPDQVGQLRMRMQSSTPGGWKRRLDLEERLQRMHSTSEGSFCFSKQFEHIQNTEFAVWLQARGFSELRVSNVVPLTRRKELSYSEHNLVLTDLKETLLYELLEGLRIHVIQVPVSLGLRLENFLSPEALRDLTEFSRTANKIGLHPLDIKRWNSFVVQTHSDQLAVASDLLDAWLEDEGWPDAMRARLVSEYESGRSLLTTYEEELAPR
jgi:hypothetical protein